ncbi:MAG: hypothetical protein A3H57_01445 [Candidatus Taylorbacteria bacterium RIFCSPLOWO2_02_FULL_43_11]|nr:MAG: hypothetical protein A3H57_01445 [Candidatus Taylorbacteria bacterium RIFCSPLOWO2_02_FULL_43_11]
MKKHKKQKKIDAKSVFDKYVMPKIIGKNSDETIAIFCTLDYNYFYNVATKYKLKERQISSLVGFKDEFFILTLVSQIIKELKLEDIFSFKKVTANRNSGLSARKIFHNGKEFILKLGGDFVIFRKQNNKPVMIIECKEYIDMIRLKEVIGESRLIKDKITRSTNLLEGVQFCIVANVLELTEEWGAWLNSSDLKHRIDKIFILREGKRKDKTNKPVKATLLELKDFVIRFLKDAQ